jgi:hypothetical protein
MDRTTQAVLTAKAKRLDGCHYLTGAAGATPGNADGAAYRRGEVGMAAPSFDPKAPCIFAAESSILGHSICGGRWSTFGRDARPSDWDLTHYLKQQEEKYAQTRTLEPYYKYYTPRLTKTKGKSGQLAWGEDCRNKRHFDCIGLVNYLLSSVCDMKKSYKEKGFSADILQHKGSTKRIALDAPSEAGDILYKKMMNPDGSSHDHIGLLLMDDTVIQAEQTSVGVTIKPYKGTGWDYRGRYDDSLFICLSQEDVREERRSGRESPLYAR